MPPDGARILLMATCLLGLLGIFWVSKGYQGARNTRSTQGFCSTRNILGILGGWGGERIPHQRLKAVRINIARRSGVRNLVV